MVAYVESSTSWLTNFSIVLSDGRKVQLLITIKTVIYLPTSFNDYWINFLAGAVQTIVSFTTPNSSSTLLPMYPLRVVFRCAGGCLLAIADRSGTTSGSYVTQGGIQLVDSNTTDSIGGTKTTSVFGVAVNNHMYRDIPILLSTTGFGLECSSGSNNHLTANTTFNTIGLYGFYDTDWLYLGGIDTDTTTGNISYVVPNRYSILYLSNSYTFASTPATQYVTAGSTLSSLPTASSVIEYDSLDADVNYSFPEGSGTLSDSSSQTVPITYAARYQVESWWVGTTNIGSPGAAFYPSSSVVAVAHWGTPKYESSGLPTSSAFTTKGFTASEGYDVGSLWNYNGTSVAYGDVFPSLTFTGLVDSITLSTSSNISLTFDSNGFDLSVESKVNMGGSYSIPSADSLFTIPTTVNKPDIIVGLDIVYDPGAGTGGPEKQSIYDPDKYRVTRAETYEYTFKGYWTSTTDDTTTTTV